MVSPKLCFYVSQNNDATISDTKNYKLTICPKKKKLLHILGDQAKHSTGNENFQSISCNLFWGKNLLRYNFAMCSPFYVIYLRVLLFYLPVASTHKETKQFYTLYNTLDDTKLYLEKEVFLMSN